MTLSLQALGRFSNAVASKPAAPNAGQQVACCCHHRCGCGAVLGMGSAAAQNCCCGCQQLWGNGAGPISSKERVAPGEDSERSRSSFRKKPTRMHACSGQHVTRMRPRAKAPGYPTYRCKTFQSLAERSVKVTSWPAILMMEVLLRGSPVALIVCLWQLGRRVIVSPFNALAFPPHVRFLLHQWNGIFSDKLLSEEENLTHTRTHARKHMLNLRV